MTKEVKIGNITIGGTYPIAIQSMTNTHTFEIEKTLCQISDLKNVGCDIVRIAVLDQKDADAIIKIKDKIDIPLVADIHFNYKLAISAIENGVDKIRINPGNIEGEDKLNQIIDCAKHHHIPIRIGANGGSINKEYLSKYSDKNTAMVNSVIDYVHYFAKRGFSDIVLSSKSSNLADMIDVNRKLSALTDCPLHIGVTEAGVKEVALVKNSIGIGSLLLDNIGSTIRVSLTDNPIEEVFAAKQILLACGKIAGIKFVSCPTCGRCQVELVSIAKAIYDGIKNIKANLTVAVMGCAVNGPGEASDADIGIAFGGTETVKLFKNGNYVMDLPVENITENFIKIVKEFANAVKYH